MKIIGREKYDLMLVVIYGFHWNWLPCTVFIDDVTADKISRINYEVCRAICLNSHMLKAKHKSKCPKKKLDLKAAAVKVLQSIPRVMPMSSRLQAFIA